MAADLVCLRKIVIRRCTMKDGHGGVVIGSEISGGCRNVFCRRLQWTARIFERVLAKVKRCSRRVIEKFHCANITVGQVRDAVFKLILFMKKAQMEPYKPVARNIDMENITVDKTRACSMSSAFPC